MKRVSYIFLLALSMFGCTQQNKQQMITSSRPFDREALEALVQRIIPNHEKDFIIESIPATDDGKDVFELSMRDGKVVLAGNNGISVAGALNYYIKYVCESEYSWSNLAPVMMDKLPPVAAKVRKVGPYRYRYYMNYCTFSYSTAWWDWKRWEKELDWMALNGINMPLAPIGQEAVWQRVYRRLGFDDEQINAFFAGPAYCAFNWMGCLDGWRGPLPQSWIDSHEALQKQILSRARSLGMTPVLPAFTGHVLPRFNELFPQSKLQKVYWSGFDAVNLLDASDTLFSQIGTAFIEELTKTYGTDHLYSADTFIEMTPPSNNPADIAGMTHTLYQCMAEADPDAVWVMQGWLFHFNASFWQEEQRKALLNVVADDKLVMLDLWSEEHPMWEKTHAYEGKPWIWCLLSNFGGRSGIGGRMDTVAISPATAKAHPQAGNMCGIGLTMEAIENNPPLYELMMENTWTDKSIDIDEWLSHYVRRRYGCDSEAAREAWRILHATLYRNGYDEMNSANYQAICLQPKFYTDTTMNCSFLPALDKLLADSATLKQSDGYRYDVVNLTRQAMNEQAHHLLALYHQAYLKKDLAEMNRLRKQFIALLDDMDTLLATRRDFMFGTWLQAARAHGTNEAEKSLYDLNARSLLTQWDSPQQRNTGLNDYACRQWAGLIRQYYKPRWTTFFDYIESCTTAEKEPDWKTFYRDLRLRAMEWMETPMTFATEPEGNEVEAAKRIWGQLGIRN